MRPADRAAFANIRPNVRHGLTASYARPWHLGADIWCGFEDGVPPAAGLVDILCFQRDAHAAGRCVGIVDCVVAPPGAVVVPDVVVGVRAMCVHAPTSTEGVGHPLS